MSSACLGGVILSIEGSSFDLAVVICIGEPLIDHSLVPPSRRISIKFVSSKVGLFLDSSFKSLLKLSPIPCALSKIKKNLQKNFIFKIQILMQDVPRKRVDMGTTYRCSAGTHK